jgi:hypothetical protein
MAIPSHISHLPSGGCTTNAASGKKPAGSPDSKKAVVALWPAPFNQRLTQRVGVFHIVGLIKYQSTGVCQVDKSKQRRQEGNAQRRNQAEMT